MDKMRLIAVSFIILFLTALSGCKKAYNPASSNNTSSKKFTVSGIVSDNNGNPVSGYRVKAKDAFSFDYTASATTDSKGKYELILGGGGNDYSIDVFKPGSSFTADTHTIFNLDKNVIVDFTVHI